MHRPPPVEDAELVRKLDASRSSVVHHRDRLREVALRLLELDELRESARLVVLIESLREADALLSAAADDLRSMRRIDARRVS